jgi:hypothetical protein
MLRRGAHAAHELLGPFLEFEKTGASLIDSGRVPRMVRIRRGFTERRSSAWLREGPRDDGPTGHVVEDTLQHDAAEPVLVSQPGHEPAAESSHGDVVLVVRSRCVRKGPNPWPTPVSTAVWYVTRRRVPGCQLPTATDDARRDLSCAFVFGPQRERDLRTDVTFCPGPGLQRAVFSRRITSASSSTRSKFLPFPRYAITLFNRRERVDGMFMSCGPLHILIRATI